MDGIGSCSFGERILSKLCVSNKNQMKDQAITIGTIYHLLYLVKQQGQSRCVFITHEDAYSNGSE